MYLPIFPEESLAASVTTTVWVGVFVMSLCTLRFGWTYSGIVSPGYLVPLIVVKPIAAVVIIVEAILTYFLVWFYSVYLRRWTKWSNFFGRDRFFAIIICSILVKVAFDGYLLPWVGRYVQERWFPGFDYANNLHSFGLIIVALIANQFWKPGFFRGLGPFCFSVGSTYLIVRYVLMEFTNFSIAGLEYMYEDISTSILASPKAYVILLITAFMASRMNLMYSWDYNGILIPSLLALQWYEPLKIVSSFAEAWFIYLCGRFVLKLSFLRETTVEGARKVLLFFNISFTYKLALGHLLGWLLPRFQAVDCYGFGYLLPSLIAMKMHDKGISIRLTRTTLQTSFVGAMTACVVGFALSLLPQYFLWSRTGAVAEAIAVTEVAPSLTRQVQAINVLSYEQRATGRRTAPVQGEMDAFAEGVRFLDRYVASGATEHLDAARAALRLAGFRVTPDAEGKLLHVHDVDPQRGWGLFILRRSPSSDLVVEVPAPFEEKDTIEAGARIFEELGARALAVATLATYPGAPASKEILTSHRTIFQTFHRALSSRDFLQIRGYPPKMLRAVLGRTPSTEEAEEAPSSLWVPRRLPSGIRLGRIRELARDKLHVEWDRAPDWNVQRDTARGWFAELFLSLEARRRILADFLVGTPTRGGDDGPRSSESGVDGKPSSISELLGRVEADVAPRGSELYVTPTLEALLFLDEEVLKPLLRLARGELRGSEHDDALRTIDSRAGAFGYRLDEIPGELPDNTVLVLAEDPSSATRRYWGTYVFRRGPAGPFVVEVPHPVSEQNTLQYGEHLFGNLHASALLVAGSHPKCRKDGTADVVLPSNKTSLFNVVNQVILREAKDEFLLAIQVRALGPRPGLLLPQADALVSFSDGSIHRATLGVLERRLVSILDDQRLGWVFVDGGQSTRGYEVHGSAQTLYLGHTRNKKFAALWLSPFARLGFRTSADNAAQEKQLQALGIGTEERDLDAVLGGGVSTVPLHDGLVHLVEHYQKTQDIASLDGIVKGWPTLRLRRIIDKESQRPFLVFQDGTALLPLVAALDFTPVLESGQARVRTVSPPLDREAVRKFVASGEALLRIE